MEDNTIYNYFKTRKHQFDETPGDALWAKIESGLDTTTTSQGKGFSFKTLSFLATALLTIGIAGLAVLNSANDIKKPAAPPQEDKPGKLVSKPVTAPETVKPADAAVTAGSSQITAGKPAIMAETVKDTVKKKKPYIAFQKINGKTTSIGKDSIPFDINNIETIVSSTNGRVTVNTKEKLTPSQFEQLIEKILKENEQAVGTLVTIKAPGHKVFRQIIKTKDNTYPARQSGIYDTLPTKLTVKSINNQSGVFEKILLSKDSLVIEPEYIDFKLAEPGKE